MKTKTSISLAVVLVILLLGIAGVIWHVRRPDSAPSPTVPTASTTPPIPHPPRTAAVALPAIPNYPLPGQGRATVEPSDDAGRVIAGRVIN